MEFKYVINQNSSDPIMLINKTIGGPDGINGADFQRELLYLDTMGKNSIEIMINSGGGSVFDGMSIASAIINCNTPIITNNVGIAASIAGVIFMSAKNRIMADYGLLMMHNVSGGNDKSREELNNSIALMLSKNSSLSKDQVKKLMSVETWENYNQCIKNGFCNDGLGQVSTNVVFTENAYEDIFDYANNIIKKINMNEEKSEIKIDETLENDLSKNEDISNETATNESEELENAAKNPWMICTARVGREDKAKYEACVMAVKKEMGVNEDMEEPMNDIDVSNEKVEDINNEAELNFQNVIDEKDAIIKQLQEEIAKIKADEAEKEVTNFINEYVELGKISNETRESWTNLCKKDFENTKEIIKSLNINREAPRFDNKITGEKKPESIQDFMNFGKNK